MIITQNNADEIGSLSKYSIHQTKLTRPAMRNPNLTGRQSDSPSIFRPALRVLRQWRIGTAYFDKRRHL